MLKYGRYLYTSNEASVITPSYEVVLASLASDSCLFLGKKTDQKMIYFSANVWRSPFREMALLTSLHSFWLSTNLLQVLLLLFGNSRF